ERGAGWARTGKYTCLVWARRQTRSFLHPRFRVPPARPMTEPGVGEVPNPTPPCGPRGAAEVNICPPMAAIANAIERATGRRLTELPMSPPKVLAAIDSLGQK